MFKVTLFFLKRIYHAEEETAEKALGVIEKQLGKQLTFRPFDGCVFLPYAHIPCGVIYQKGYND